VKKAIFLFTLMCLGAAVAFVVGCGSDNSTNTTEKKTGSLNDPQFLAAQEAVSAVGEYDGLMLGLAFQALDSVFHDPSNPSPIRNFRRPVATSTAADTVELTYHADSKYWMFYTVHYDTSSTDPLVVTRFVIKDSTQFLQGMDVVQWPDSALLTEFRNGVHASITANNTTDSIYIHQLVTIAGDIPNLGDVTIDGSRGFEINFSDTGSADTCTFGLNMGAVANSVGLNVTDLDQNGCPTSGNSVYAGSINVSCVGQDTASYSGGWTITETFNGNLINYVFENSTTRWTYTDTCHTQASASPYERISRLQSRSF
jgi:hypothetical protein